MKFKLIIDLLIIVLIDVLLIGISFYLSHQLRFEFDVPKLYMDKFYQMLPFLIFCKLSVFYFFDLYKGIRRYTSLNDLLSVVKAVCVSSVLFILFVLWQYRFEGVSRSVFLIDMCFSFLLIGGLRVVTRLTIGPSNGRLNIKELPSKLFRKVSADKSAVRIIIAGAGGCGEKLFREIKDNSSIKYKVVGFLDDDSKKIGRKIHGIKVVDCIEHLADVVESTRASEVIIAIPSAGPKRMKEIISLCDNCNVTFKIVPGMGELINGKVTVKAIRDVEYRDLLGRKPVDLDNAKIGRYLKGRVVLVTGAGGSIGSGLCHQIARYSPECIVLFERAESPLYEIEMVLNNAFPDIRIIPCLGDIQNKPELEKVFKIYRPGIVFHAAAYKHVPMLEIQSWKAVQNNIFGTKNVVDTADKFRCGKFVFVSTDKAVNPVSIMGASKRVSEMIVQNKSLVHQSATSFITVRFGNVIGSVGSVIPLFKKQIKQGGPVTVTHPEMIRYFMLIPEACQLILQAGSMGKGGEIFILDMGEPVKIDEMARDLIKFSGFKPDVDINIEYIGLRPGEKLYEELMTDAENLLPTRHDSILVLNAEKCDINKLNGSLDGLKSLSQKRSNTAIKAAVKEIVPEYDPKIS